MPQAHEATRQDMQQDASDTCVSGKRHGLGTMVLTTVAGGTTDPSVMHVEDPVVRDGDAMGRAADRVSDVLRACTGWLGVDNPLCGIQLSAKLGEAPGDTQGCGALNDSQGAGGACLGERLAVLAAQDRAQGPHGKEAAGVSLHPALPGGGARASGDDAVDMARRPQGLVPGVQDYGAPDLPTKVALPTLDARLARGLEQQRHQGPLVGKDAGVEGVWQGKHQVERGDRQQRSCAGLDPLDLRQRLTRGAVAMATGVRRVPRTPTGGTLFGVPAALGAPADHASVHDLLV